MALNRPTVLAARVVLVVTLGVVMWLATSHETAPAGLHINDKLAHIAAFYCLALLIDFSFPEEGFGPRKVVLLLCYGLLIELIQRQLPYREFSLLDLTADGAGIALYPLTVPLLRLMPLFRPRWV